MDEYDYIVERENRYYIRGTRITVQIIVDVLEEDKMTLPVLAYEWDLTEDALREALALYEAREDEIQSRHVNTLDESL